MSIGAATTQVSAQALSSDAGHRRACAIAHRGAAIMTPENTLLSFRLAVEAGVDQIETDARLTADGEIVLLHDQDLARTTDGEGWVGAHTLAELRALDAGYWFTPHGSVKHPFRGLGLRVPTLDELFGLLGDIAPHVLVNIELKNAPNDAGYDPTNRLARRLAENLRVDDAVARVVVSSFNPAAIDCVKHLEPRVRTVYLAGPKADPCAELAYAVARGYNALHLQHTLLSPESRARRLVAAAHRAGIIVNVWTVNDEARMRELVALGVDGIMSDDPQRLCAVLDAHVARRSA